MRRFAREARAVASLSHGNIVAVYDVGFEENMHYIVMEFVEGESLKDYIRSMGALSTNDCVNIMCQMLEGLGYAHEHGIIHRDIKSHNIMLSLDGRVKVTDFGIAVGISDVTQTYTSSSKIMGSVQYISPEQVQGKKVTERSDIYSAGVVFYEMMTGQLPFSGDSPINVAMQHVQGEVIPPHQLNPEIPVGLSYVVMRAMRKNPEVRYASAFEMENAIRAAVEGLNSVYEPSEEDTRELEAMGDSPYEETAYTQQLQEDPPRQRASSAAVRKRNKKVIIILAVILAAAIGFLLYQVTGGFSAKEVEVPDVVGQPIEQAQETLEELGFTVDIKEEFDESNTYKIGEVMEQSIPAGQMVKGKKNITLTVSQGIEDAKVPNVLDLSETRAKAVLEAAGFKVTTSEETSEDIDQGAIIRQEPGANVPAAKGSTVNLVISSGKPTPKVSVPNVVGKTQSNAQNILSNASLKYAVTSQESSETKGTVIKQSPSAGSSVYEGAEVTIIISKGSEESKVPVDNKVTVPKLVGKTLDTAKSAIANYGLVYGGMTTEASSEYAPGIVISQSPTAGKSVNKGSKVNLVVSE